MSVIEQLASDLLDKLEIQLVEHIETQLSDDKWDSGSLIGDIMPIYCERVGDRLRSLSPSIIYRPLYYIHTYSSQRNFKEKTRTFMTFISNHLEGCLKSLKPSTAKHRASSPSFGGVASELKKDGILPDELANKLFKFNLAINISSKHFNAYMPTDWLDERTFTVKEAACAFMLMRKLSIELFALLQTNGISLPQYWPVFKTEWLSWTQMIN